jgi:hypothetical protein
VVSGHINPGLVFDFTTDLDHVADAYAAMDQRRAIKSLLTISQPWVIASKVPDASRPSRAGERGQRPLTTCPHSAQPTGGGVTVWTGGA